MDCPSTPGAPLLSLTCSQAHQTSCPLTANGFPSSGPPDTSLRPPSGLSSSMTLLPARLEDQHYYEPVRLPARQRFPPLAPPRRLRASLSPPRQGGSHVRAGSPPFPADAADQARATSTPAPPGQRSGQPPGSSRRLSCSPVPMPPSTR